MSWFKKEKKVVQQQQEIVTYNTITLDAFVEGFLKKTVDNDIYEEFIFYIKNIEQSYIVTLTKKITTLQYKYDILLFIVKWLQSVERFKKNHPDISIEKEEEQVWKALTSIVAARKTDTHEVILARGNKLYEQWKMYDRELKQLQPVVTGEKAADRNYFSRVIAAVSTYHKIQINRKSMLLCEFVEYYLLMREQQAEIEKQTKKHR